MRRAAVILLSVLVLTGCSASGNSERGGGSATTEVGPVPGGDPAFLAGLGIGDGELRDGEQAALIDYGDQVDGQITLDFCGATFRTERERVARNQTAISDADGQWAGASEVVRYEPGRAAAALDEVRDAIASCDPDQPADSNVDGVPTAYWTSTPIDDDLLPDVVEDHVAVDVTITAEDGTSQRSAFIYQRRGDLLVGTYATATDRAAELANAVGRRLAAAPADRVGD